MPAETVSARLIPSSLVTFLFTDIESSTRLWESFPQAMPSTLALFNELGDKVGVVHALESFAAAFLRDRDAEKGCVLWSALNALCEQKSTPLAPAARPAHDADIAQARATLGESSFAAAWAEGRALSREQAVEYVLGLSVGTELHR